MLITLARRSLANRRYSVLLTFVSLVISISVLLGVEQGRQQARDSFNRTVSGVDIIVGAPSGPLNLLLYSVFRMGSPTQTIDYRSFEALRDHEQVQWAIPIALGDSHRGFRVLGTNQDYFSHFRYGNKQPLVLASGQGQFGVYGAVIGHEVARQLNYKVGDRVVIAHGIGATSFVKHDKTPFVIKGILAPTGTPVDKTVHVSLAGIEAIHLPPSRLKTLAGELADGESPALTPKSLSAVMLGLKSRFAIFGLQREIDRYPGDRLMAILPGVALAELWQLMGTVENLLRGISVLVLVAALFGLATMLLASMQLRTGEIALLRVLGAGPGVIFWLVLLEAGLLVILAMVTAVGVVSAALYLVRDWLAAHYGVFLTPSLWSWDLLGLLAVILAATLVTSTIPALTAYKTALHSRLPSHQ